MTTKKETCPRSKFKDHVCSQEAAKPAHTPGPWEMRKQLVSPIGTRNLYGVGPVQDGAVWFVAENVEEGDARLIAAAPDLLAALKEIAQRANEDNIGAVRDVARAAIAKAEGK